MGSPTRITWLCLNTTGAGELVTSGSFVGQLSEPNVFPDVELASAVSNFHALVSVLPALKVSGREQPKVL